jgi:hypothetical protein
MGAAQVFYQVGMHKAGLPGLGPGISTCGCADRFMAQQLANNFVVPGICIEEDLASGMTEEVRVKLKARECADSGADLAPQRIGRFRVAATTRK